MGFFCWLISGFEERWYCGDADKDEAVVEVEEDDEMNSEGEKLSFYGSATIKKKKSINILEILHNASKPSFNFFKIFPAMVFFVPDIVASMEEPVSAVDERSSKKKKLAKASCR